MVDKRKAILRNCRVDRELRHEIHGDYPRCAAAVGCLVRCGKGDGALACFGRLRALAFRRVFSLVTLCAIASRLAPVRCQQVTWRLQTSQFSTLEPSTLTNLLTFAVTTVASTASALAAISRSFPPVGLPCCSSWARTRPYSISGRSTPTASMATSKNGSACAALPSRLDCGCSPYPPLQRW